MLYRDWSFHRSALDLRKLLRPQQSYLQRVETMPDESKKPPSDTKKPIAEFPVDHDWRRTLWYCVLALLVLWVWQDISQTLTVKVIPYSQFKRHVVDGEVTQCEIMDDSIVGKIDPNAEIADKKVESETDGVSQRSSFPNGTEPRARAEKNTTDKGDARRDAVEDVTNEPFAFRTVRIEDPDLVKQLEAAGVEFVGVQPGFMSQFLQWWLLPLALMFLFWRFLSRGIGNAGQAAMGFGRSKAKLVADTDTGVSFEDVAGCVEAKFELQEVVDFLKNPKRYVALGATIPKGVLLVGPPGTGKTLLARAVAGEADVPFYSISGSEFVEMFVGVGAARVRDLFEQGKQSAPCIIFIDELDAIGRERGVHVAMVNDEREQTLNQLLVELDGFEENAGVIILSATNRPEVLDRALLRPGRFDRQVLVDSPDVEGRLGILNVHARNKPLMDDVNLHDIARATPGFSGADLKNVMNEAALLAARRQAKEISKDDLDEAVEKVIAGPERKSRRLGDEERRRVAFHEVGHALVATHSEHADPVRKISIIPRGQAALGYTVQLPTEERFLMTRSEIDDRVRGLLGGRAAEDLVFGEVSSGAENDLEKATAMVRQMVCMFGMSDAVGLAHCGHRPASFAEAGGVFQRDCSEQTANTIDDEVKKLLGTAYQEALGILTEHRDQLNLVAEELLQKETLNEDEFQRLIAESNPADRKLNSASSAAER